MYSALAGDLVHAEAQKRKNKIVEQRETKRSYEVMESDFELARARLQQDLAQRKVDLLKSQDYKMNRLRAEHEKEIELMHSKIGFVEKMLAEEKRLAKEQRPAASQPRQLPMLNRTVANISQKNQIAQKTVQRAAQPLSLPPLQPKRKKSK
jgi:hypothetical protein